MGGNRSSLPSVRPVSLEVGPDGAKEGEEEGEEEGEKEGEEKEADEGAGAGVERGTEVAKGSIIGPTGFDRFGATGIGAGGATSTGAMAAAWALTFGAPQGVRVTKLYRQISQKLAVGVARGVPQSGQFSVLPDCAAASTLCAEDPPPKPAPAERPEPAKPVAAGVAPRLATAASSPLGVAVILAPHSEQ